MFSTFPNGWPGIGLLLLRTAAGGVLIVGCIARFQAWRDPTFLALLGAPLAIVSGAFLLVGYRTRPAAGISLAVIMTGLFLRVSRYTLFESKLAAALVCVIAAAVICLGPGAFSLDSRLFGRREIIIPTRSDAG